MEVLPNQLIAGDVSITLDVEPWLAYFFFSFLTHSVVWPTERFPVFLTCLCILLVQVGRPFRCSECRKKRQKTRMLVEAEGSKYAESWFPAKMLRALFLLLITVRVFILYLFQLLILFNIHIHQFSHLCMKRRACFQRMEVNWIHAVYKVIFKSTENALTEVLNCFHLRSSKPEPTGSYSWRVFFVNFWPAKI